MNRIELETALRPGVDKLVPSVLLPVQFQNRFPLTWNPDYLSEGKVSLQKVIEALIEKYPSAQTHEEILAKVALHAITFCPQWFMLKYEQPLYMYLPPEARPPHGRMLDSLNGRRPVIQPGYTVLGEVEVCAQEDEFGSARYTCRNYYQTDISITEELVQEAIDEDSNDPVGYLLNLIQLRDDRVDVTQITDGQSDDYEYDDYTYVESDNFETTNDNDMARQLTDIVEDYQVNTGYGVENDD